MLAKRLRRWKLFPTTFTRETLPTVVMHVVPQVVFGVELLSTLGAGVFDARVLGPEVPLQVQRTRELLAAVAARVLDVLVL